MPCSRTPAERLAYYQKRLNTLLADRAHAQRQIDKLLARCPELKEST